MSFKKPVLSICIPTYNRANYLMEALNSISKQIESGFLNSVEIVIADNASTDNTQEVINNFQSEHPNISFTRFLQERNLGFDGNIYTVIQNATGEFIWVLSDDDLLFPQAIKAIFQIIDGFPEEHAFCPNMCGFVESVDSAENSFFDVSINPILGHDNCLIYLNHMITFLSMLIFRRSLICNNDYSSRMGSDIIHSYLFLDILLISDRMRFIPEPLLAVRLFNSGGYSFFKILVSNVQELLDEAIRRGYSKKATIDMKRRYLRTQVYPTIYNFKMRDSHTRTKPNYVEGIRIMTPIYGRDSFFWTHVMPYVLCPSPVMRVLVKSKARIEGILSKKHSRSI